MNERRFFASYGEHGTLVYDLLQHSIVRALTDFSMHLLGSRVQASKITERIRMEHLVEFWEYLHSTPPSKRDISDNLLEEYRDLQLTKVQKRPQAIGITGAAKQTVNGKLVSIYKWLEWMQSCGRMPQGSIGPIKCMVTVYPTGGSGVLGGQLGGGRQYPLTYKRTGQNSKHRASLALTKDQMDAAVVHLVELENEYIGLRDSLALDIAVETGMRRASINSLRASMFEREKLSREPGMTFSIRPAIQKFSYENDMNFPVELGLRIAAFIEGPRADLLRSKSSFAKNAKDHIFLSSRDCRPLTDRALSQSVSAAMKAVGAGKGIGLHAGRRAYANIRIEDETTRRSELGLDTSTDSIAATVSMEMNHRNSSSIYPYVAREQSRRAMSEVASAMQKKRPEKQ